MEVDVSGSSHAEGNMPGDLGLDRLFREEARGQATGEEGSDRSAQVTLTSPLGIDCTRLGELQKEEFPELVREAEGDLAGSESPTHFFVEKGVLMRQWRPVREEAGDDMLRVRRQVGVPVQHRGTVLKLAHSVDPAGHLGVNKTLSRLREYFYWPGMDADVRRICKTCFPCQRAGKNVPAIPKAPLVPVPAFGQAFERLIIEVVGPLPRTRKGNNYLLTIMCASTRFPEAIPVQKVTSRCVMGHLQRFFAWIASVWARSKEPITDAEGAVDGKEDISDSGRTQVCHINRLKLYFPEEQENARVKGVTQSQEGKLVLCMEMNQVLPAEERKWARADGTRLSNTESLTHLEDRVRHLDKGKRRELVTLIRRNKSLFTDVPRRHKSVVHEVDVCGGNPIKQSAYRVSPKKRKIMRQEVEYLLANDLAEPSNCEWSSLCVLVKKSDGSYRFCTDYRKVNAITVSDSHPLPRIGDCVDQVGNARFVTKVDLLKGYYQIPLSPSARRISAFATPDGLYQYKVLPFGMKNSRSCFQRMMNAVLRGMEGCAVYIDDIVVYADSWKQHMNRLTELFQRLEEANLTVNLTKSEFGKARLEYLGFAVGQGEVTQ
ncbi:uncharacterized protein [Procambarus clarkii]|uniref:uncharacterized protein n=1 Tax=Procambarus clarkii TaxID=6728 RepID=UPI00374334E9